ncbi:MAG: hypothetical protein V1787_06240 [Candidatus Micrarchaeota archaeon]
MPEQQSRRPGVKAPVEGRDFIRAKRRPDRVDDVVRILERNKGILPSRPEGLKYPEDFPDRVRRRLLQR